MIIPCMKSISACESGGSTPCVEAGRTLLGWPGAPGWTMTGAEDFCASATEQNKTAVTKMTSGVMHPKVVEASRK
jgi:hypothetical protein